MSTSRGARIRWGILGTGHIADVFAADLALLSDEAELAAVASRHPGRAAEFASRHGFDRSYGSYPELAEDTAVDVVYVATPHHDHYASARSCLEAGKAVLVEKPLTTGPADTERLITLARDRGLFLMEALWTRTNPLMRKVSELVGTQAVGPIRHLWLNFGFHFTGSDDHRLLSPELGGGAILDLGIYPVHIAHLLLGQPGAITGSGHLASTGVDAHASAVLRYPGDAGRPPATAAITASLDAAMDNTAVIYGETGRLMIDHLVKPSKITVVQDTPGTADAGEYITQLPGGGYTLQAQEVMGRLRSGQLESDLVPWQDTQAVSTTLARWRQLVEHSASGQQS